MSSLADKILLDDRKYMKVRNDIKYVYPLLTATMLLQKQKEFQKEKMINQKEVYEHFFWILLEAIQNKLNYIINTKNWFKNNVFVSGADIIKTYTHRTFESLSCLTFNDVHYHDIYYKKLVHQSFSRLEKHFIAKGYTLKLSQHKQHSHFGILVSWSP